MSSKCNTRRTFDNVCFCAQNVQLPSRMKPHITDIAQTIHPSTRLYTVTMNSTFMKQNRVQMQLGKEFTGRYIKPLMQNKKTISIKIQTLRGVSTILLLHMMVVAT